MVRHMTWQALLLKGTLPSSLLFASNGYSSFGFLWASIHENNVERKATVRALGFTALGSLVGLAAGPATAVLMIPQTNVSPILSRVLF